MHLPMRKTLTKQEVRFIEAVARGNEPAVVARAEGYLDSKEWYRLLRRPAVAAAIDLEVRKQLSTELAPLAIQHYRNVLTNSNASDSDKNTAARAVLDRAGIVAPKAPESPEKDHKDLGEMTTDELMAIVAETDKELSTRAVSARDITPSDKPKDDQLSDLM